MMVGMRLMLKGALRQGLSGFFHLQTRGKSERTLRRRRAATHSARSPMKTRVLRLSGTSLSTSDWTSEQSGHQGLPVAGSMDAKKIKKCGADDDALLACWRTVCGVIWVSGKSSGIVGRCGMTRTRSAPMRCASFLACSPTLHSSLRSGC